MVVDGTCDRDLIIESFQSNEVADSERKTYILIVMRCFTHVYVFVI